MADASIFPERRRMSPKLSIALVLAVAFAAVSIARDARADDACRTTSDCPDDEHCISEVCRRLPLVDIPQRYGEQIAIADIIAVATLGTGAIFSGPIVHLIHHRPLTALASFGVRVGGIALGAGSGVLLALAMPPAAFEGSGCASCPASPDYLPQMFVGMLIGAGVGWIVSSILDATFLGHSRR